MLGRKRIYMRSINCSYNNVAKCIRLLDKKQFLFIKEKFHAGQSFWKIYPLKSVNALSNIYVCGCSICDFCLHVSLSNITFLNFNASFLSFGHKVVKMRVRIENSRIRSEYTLSVFKEQSLFIITLGKHSPGQRRYLNGYWLIRNVGGTPTIYNWMIFEFNLGCKLC